MIEQILQELETALTAAGGEMLYTDFVNLIDGPARVNVVNAARARFNFSLRLENGVMKHYVSLKS